jgi:hypothetical protein
MTTVAYATVGTVSIGERFQHNREHVRCNRCELTQYQAELCRRCKKPLPKPLKHFVTMEIPLSDEVDGRFFGRGIQLVRGILLISVAELERKAIAHALAEADKAIEAASRLDIGKTVLYQQVAQIFGNEANALRRELVRARDEVSITFSKLTGSATFAAPTGSSSSWQSTSLTGSGPPPTPDQPERPD